MHKVIANDTALLEADDLAGEIDKEIEAGAVPGYGTPDFDIDAYITQKAQGRAKRVMADDAAAVAFGGALDKLKGRFNQSHETALGQTQTMMIENAARNTLDRAVSTAMESTFDISGQQISDGLRDIYKELGPRLGGGSLDVRYARMDDLLLEALESKVKDPRYVRKALQVLDARRMSLDGTRDMGRIGDSARLAGKVATLQAAGTKTLADEFTSNIEVQGSQAAVEALRKRDGTFTTLQQRDIPNKYDPSKKITLWTDGKKKEAVQAFIAETRARNGGQIDFDEEMDVVLKNDVAHPEFVPILQSGFSGAMNTNVSKDGVPGPDQVQAIRAGADLYARIADRNSTYVEKHLSRDAVMYYETFSTLTRDMGYTDDQAAAALGRAYSSNRQAQTPDVIARNLTEIRDAVKLDFSWYPWKGETSNQWMVQTELVDVANSLMRVDGISADKAIERAKEIVTQRSVYINGNAISSPGIMAGDEQPLQDMLDGLFKAHEAEFKKQGIESSSDLSFLPRRDGTLSVVKAYPDDLGSGISTITLPVTEQVNGKDATRWREPRFTPADIQSQRSYRQRHDNDKAVKTAVEDHTAKPFAELTSEERRDWARRNSPDNLLRRLFGYEPH
jgi:hypothetical protein